MQVEPARIREKKRTEFKAHTQQRYNSNTQHRSMFIASAEGVRVLQEAVLVVGVVVAHERLQGQCPESTEANLSKKPI